jgi:hypothetical protein
VAVVAVQIFQASVFLPHKLVGRLAVHIITVLQFRMWRCRQLRQVCKVRRVAQVQLQLQTVQAVAVVLQPSARTRLQQLAVMVVQVTMSAHLLQVAHSLKVLVVVVAVLLVALAVQALAVQAAALQRQAQRQLLTQHQEAAVADTAHHRSQAATVVAGSFTSGLRFNYERTILCTN